MYGNAHVRTAFCAAHLSLEVFENTTPAISVPVCKVRFSSGPAQHTIPACPKPYVIRTHRRRSLSRTLDPQLRLRVARASDSRDPHWQLDTGLEAAALLAEHGVRGCMCTSVHRLPPTAHWRKDKHQARRRRGAGAVRSWITLPPLVHVTVTFRAPWPCGAVTRADLSVSDTHHASHITHHVS